MSTEWTDCQCFGCKEWFRAKVENLRKHAAPGRRGSWYCLHCITKLETRRSIQRVSDHLGQVEQDQAQGRLFNE